MIYKEPEVDEEMKDYILLQISLGVPLDKIRKFSNLDRDSFDKITQEYDATQLDEQSFSKGPKF